MSEKVLFTGVKDGEIFEVAGIEFIKFPSVDGRTPAVARNFVNSMRYGEKPNLMHRMVHGRTIFLMGIAKDLRLLWTIKF